MMRTNVAACLLLLTLSNVINCAHEPPPGVPSFLRSSVESVPDVDPLENLIKSEALTSAGTHGERFLPLRSAVESVPSVPKESERSFIRSSVEFVPERERDSLRYEPVVAASNLKPSRTSAYVLPQTHEATRTKTYDPSNPQPFRSGSPYQQLIDTRIVHDDLLSRYHGKLKSGSDDGDVRSKQIFCHITNWSFYRYRDGKFVPENLDPKLCTYIIYSFGSLDPSTLTVKEFDKWTDIDNALYERVTRLSHGNDVKVLLAIGGWTDSSGDKYSRLVSDASARQSFIHSLIQYLNQYGFQGVHFDWNFPKCWQSDCRKGPESDRPNFTKFIKELSAELRKHSYTLTLGISGYKEIILKAYEIPELSNAVDYLLVATYDYHGAWEKKTGHVSPLYGRNGEKYPQYNVDYTLQLLLREGVERAKVILGIPFYGQSFTLQEPGSRLIGEGFPTRGPGKPGEITRQPGMLAYYEICDRIKNFGWRRGIDGAQKSGPFATFNDQWVGYEDVDSVAIKAQYVIDNRFAGVAAWTVDLDDFTNRCCLEPFPLLRSINRAFQRLKTPKPFGLNCKKPAEPVTPIAPVTTTVGESGIPGPGFSEQGTTWPSWNTASTTTTSKPTAEYTWWPTSSTTTTTQRTTTTRRTTTTTTEEPVVEDVDESHYPPNPVNTMPDIHGPCRTNGEYESDPAQCDVYYLCVFGMKQMFHCPAGLVWNKDTRVCDWPKRDSHCNTIEHDEVIMKKPTTTSSTTERDEYEEPSTTRRTTRKPLSTTTVRTTRSTTTIRPSVLAASEPCVNGELYPNIDDCEGFFVCVNNRLVRNFCGYGYHYDQTAKRCDSKQRVRCVPASRYLKFIGKLDQYQLDDPCNGELYASYPGNCDKYLLCLYGSLQSADCGPGLHWNQEGQLCDWPENAKCDASGEVFNEVDEDDDEGYAVTPATTTTTTTRRPKPVTPEPPVKENSGHFKLVCYFTNWAWYRKGIAKYTPDDIDDRLCTHIVYGFAVLDYTELTIRTHDSWADIDNRFYDRVAGLSRKGIKVSLALGGWNDSQGDKYSRLVRSEPARKKFVRHAVEFCKKYGFGGLDLDWEYPVCWQTECNKGFSDEKEGFTALVRELRTAFDREDLLLSTAVSPSKQIIDKGYDVKELGRLFDWIAVMTYDFHGQWDKKTGHVAPLYYHPEDDLDYFNANFSLNYWIEKGAPRRKIVMGMPLYGQSFTLSDPKNTGLNSKAPGPGQAGEYTRAAGFLAYYEICDRVNNKGWTVVQDPKRRMGPYAYKGNQWVSYDDKAMIRQKAELVRSLGLGGGMVWALDLDDFKNSCGEGAHPLLRELERVLADPPNESDQRPPVIDTSDSHDEASSDNDEVADLANVETLDSDVNDADVIDQVADQEYKVVCYFTNWAWYRQSGGKFLPEDIDPKLCTHIVYGFAVLDRDSLTIKPHDTWADFDNKFYERVVAFKKKGLKVTCAIGGWNDSAGDKYSRLVRSAAARARFIKHVIEFLKKHNFDGLDLDWEYPVCWQVECSKGFADEKQNFAQLVQELSVEFKPRGLLLSSAVSPSKMVIDAGYDVKKLSRYMDWIAVMAYDYHGQWDKKTGHVAPMYAHPQDDNVNFNTNFTIHYWIQQGADPRKLVLGMPMYGQSFSLADNSRHGLNSQTYGGGEAGDATRARGFLSYYEICDRITNKGWTVVRDPQSRMGPYAYLRDQWVSFDDARMIRHKSEYIKAMNLGGGMIWALDLDDFRNNCGCEEYPLLRTINRVLRNYPGKHPRCELEKTPSEVTSDDPSSDNDVVVLENPEKPSEAEKPLVPEKPVTVKPTQRPKPPQKPKPPTTQKPFEAEACSERFQAHESDCTKYYICNQGHLELQTCPNALHWNRNSNICDWPHNAGCTSHEDEDDPSAPPTSPRPTTTTVRTTRKPRPTLPVDEPVEVDNGEFKVVCYFTNWAWYRPGDGKYTPDDIDENLCTHIVYGFAVLDGSTLTIKTHDSWADIDNNFYDRVTEFKKKGIKVSLAIGGWNDSAGDKYSKMVLSPDNRARFVTSVIDFIEKYHFEGLDLDWEYPVCWQVECHRGNPKEKPALVELLRELSEEFVPRRWTLSAAVSPSRMVIDAGYDIPGLARYLDWIAVMTYDFHGQWDRKTGHVAPLYYYPGDQYDYFNANFTINYWIEKGAPSRKIVMGCPMYGQSFVLSSAQNFGLNAPSYGGGEAGKFTRANGFLSYYEICEKTNRDGWSVVRDPQGRIGPYAHKGNQWVSYDDVEDIRRKSKYMRDLNLGGGMIWALDLDDFRGNCGCGKHPLLKTMNQVLRGIGGPKINNCT